MSNQISHTRQPSASQGATSSNSVASASSKLGTPVTGDRVSNASVDQVRARAYEISQARSGGAGDADSDWSQAELELSVSATDKR